MRISAPWYFEFASGRMHSGKRGGWAMMRALEVLGFLSGNAGFQLRDGTVVQLPLNAPGVHDASLPDWYEAEAIALVVKAIDAGALPYTLIDCGADVGLYSRLVLAAAKKHIAQVIAFEPNSEIFPRLCENLAPELTGITAQLFDCGVADFNGFGQLVAPGGNTSTHAFFVERATVETDLYVRTLDSLELPAGANLIIKLDIEGAEMSALQGASNLLRDAGHLILQIEAHPDVAKRTGCEPMDMINHLRALRPFSVTACVERPARVYPLTRFDEPLFSQLPPDQIYDLVMISGPLSR